MTILIWSLSSGSTTCFLYDDYILNTGRMYTDCYNLRVCVSCAICKRTGYYQRPAVVRVERERDEFKKGRRRREKRLKSRRFGPSVGPSVFSLPSFLLLSTTFRYIPIDRPMTRQRQSLLQQLMVMVVVTAQVTLMLMLTTSVFPCDAAAAAAAGPPWSSLATGPSDHAGLYCDFEDQQCR